MAEEGGVKLRLNLYLNLNSLLWRLSRVCSASIHHQTPSSWRGSEDLCYASVSVSCLPCVPLPVQSSVVLIFLMQRCSRVYTLCSKQKTLLFVPAFIMSVSFSDLADQLIPAVLKFFQMLTVQFQHFYFISTPHIQKRPERKDFWHEWLRPQALRSLSLQ